MNTEIKFTKIDLTTLAKLLKPDQITLLTKFLKMERTLWSKGKAEKPFSEQIENIKDTGKLASKLKLKLSTIHPKEKAVFDHGCGGHFERKELIRDLSRLHKIISDSLKNMPPKRSRESRPMLVNLIAQAIHGSGIVVSSYPTSRFMKIAHIAFSAVNATSDPTRSILAYKASLAT